MEPTPPTYTAQAATEVANALRERAIAMEDLAKRADNMNATDWGLALADLALDVYAYGITTADSAAAVAVLGGASIRTVAEHLGVAPNTLPRRLAGTPELADYAENSRVTNGAIERARWEHRHGQYTVEGQTQAQAVERRRR